MSEDSPVWLHALQRYGAIHERISSYPDDDESEPLMELCAKRDLFMKAARSGNAADLRAAMDASRTLPGPYTPPMTAPATPAEEREKLKQRVHNTMIRDCDSTVPDQWCIETGVCSCQLMLDLLSSPSVESVRREALEEAIDAVDKALENGSPRETWTSAEIAADEDREEAIESIRSLISRPPRSSWRG